MAPPYKQITINGKQMFEHRHVMEKHLGRKLSSDEFVHHIDDNGLNNDISNLQIMTHGEHQRFHETGKKHTAEHNENISKGGIVRFARLFAKEGEREKYSEARRGEKNAFYNKKHTEESKRKISKAMTGKKATEEARERMSEAQYRRWAKKKTLINTTMGESSLLDYEMGMKEL